METREDETKKVQAAFDELSPFEKVGFMEANLEWAACSDLQVELEARGYYVRHIGKI